MKKKKWLIGCIFCVVVACICGTYIIHYYWKESQNKDIYKEVQKEAAKPDVNLDAPDKDKEVKEKAPDEEIPIDFDELEKINPDI